MEIKGNVTINISFTKHANIQFNTFLGFSGPFLGVFCFSTPLVKHKLHLKYAKLLYTARARKRANARFFEILIDYVDGGKFLECFYSKIVYRILYIFSGIVFHSIPYDQFQIGVDIFTFEKNIPML